MLIGTRDWASSLARSAKATARSCSSCCANWLKSSSKTSSTLRSSANSAFPATVSLPASRLFPGHFRRGVLALDVFQAGRFAPETTEVIQLGPANLGGAHQLHFIDHPGVDGEDALDAMAEAHLTHRKAGLGPAGAGDHNAFEHLEAFLVAFLDLHVHADAVARCEVGNVTALSLGQEFFDNQVRHDR